MIRHCLTPADVDCEFESNCNKHGYDTCTKCENNKIATKKRNKEKSKKNFFKRLK